MARKYKCWACETCQIVIMLAEASEREHCDECGQKMQRRSLVAISQKRRDEIDRNRISRSHVHCN